MPQYHGTPRVLISITATLSHSAISLSKPPRDPIILTLSLTLKNTTEPITIYLRDSFACPDQIGTSGYHLYNTDTGKSVEPHEIICSLRAMRPITVNPHADLLTLYPGVPTKTNVRIGIAPSTNPNVDPKSFLSGASLENIPPEETYRLRWHPTGDWAMPVVWGKFGTVKGTLKERFSLWDRLRGRTDFQINPGDHIENRVQGNVKIEMDEGPELFVDH